MRSAGLFCGPPGADCCPAVLRKSDMNSLSNVVVLASGTQVNWQLAVLSQLPVNDQLGVRAGPVEPGSLNGVSVHVPAREAGSTPPGDVRV